MDIGDRVIDGDEVKTFQRKAIVLYLDTVFGDRYQEADIYFENPVPVRDHENNIVGWATLHREGKVLEAEFFLDYHNPIRLDIEAGNKWYPTLDGIFFTSTTKLHVMYGGINQIVLKRGPENLPFKADPL